MRIFTPILSLLVLLLCVGTIQAQLNTGTGVPWGTLSPVEQLVLDEDFQGFEFFHSDENSDQGNSDNAFAGDGSIIYGYKIDSLDVPVLNGGGLEIKYYFNICAFAPEWEPAYSFRDGGGTTENVSNGFLEISRDYPFSEPPTVRGEFIVDLRALDFVEVIQWSHSSTGGNKRGVMVEISLDDGTSWDTLRYQPGEVWSNSFTRDPITGITTSNGFRCDPSAYGMTWEDGIYAENVMLRFLEAGGQTPRIHDLKVYGTFTPVVSTDDLLENDLKITQVNRRIDVSERADLRIFGTDGRLVRTVTDTDQVYLDEVPAGIYIVHANAAGKTKVTKVLLR